MKRAFLVIAIVLLAQPVIPAQQGSAVQAPSRAIAVDEIFAKWTTSTPGCAVGVAIAGKPVLMKAYGMADLERSVKNTPETVFEAGSLSKQFTAMAVQLLANDGKLKLDDPVRKYIPELPEYAWPVTIRHMLGLVFAFGWEQVTLALPGYLKQFTVAYYLQALVPHTMPSDGVTSILQGMFRETPPIYVCLFWLFAYLGVFLYLATRVVERKEYILEQ